MHHLDKLVIVKLTISIHVQRLHRLRDLLRGELAQHFAGGQLGDRNRAVLVLVEAGEGRLAMARRQRPLHVKSRGQKLCVGEAVLGRGADDRGQGIHAPLLLLLLRGEVARDRSECLATQGVAELFHCEETVTVAVELDKGPALLLDVLFRQHAGNHVQRGSLESVPASEPVQILDYLPRQRHPSYFRLVARDPLVCERLDRCMAGLRGFRKHLDDEAHRVLGHIRPFLRVKVHGRRRNLHGEVLSGRA
mmetsp:Transcript_4239/g.10478  ORF Transcript_4239/g.10478 Transcript_4239/m.10478 type:complete len:249 (+) Transcript_4239:128-874(+)